MSPRQREVWRERGEPAAREAARLARLVREQAAAEAAQVLSDGRAAAEQVRAAADAEAEEIRAAARRAGEERGVRGAAVILAGVEAETQRAWLRAREELIEEAFAQAASRLDGLAQMAGAGVALGALIREGLSAMAGAPAVVRLPRDYQPLLVHPGTTDRADPPGEPRFEWSPVAGGGVIVESEDGRRRFDNSFAARLRRMRPTLRREVARMLLADEPSAAWAPPDAGAAIARPGRSTP